VTFIGAVSCSVTFSCLLPIDPVSQLGRTCNGTRGAHGDAFMPCAACMLAGFMALPCELSCFANNACLQAWNG
jgi:hypothetical protein